MNKKFPYEDIVSLKNPRPKDRIPLDMSSRAAQFAPFSAVVGHRAAIDETARYTEEKRELDEYEKEIISSRLSYIKEQLPNEYEITVVYFLPDKKKSGGVYKKYVGVIYKIREIDRCLIMKDGTEIPIDDLLEIDSHIFEPCRLD